MQGPSLQQFKAIDHQFALVVSDALHFEFADLSFGQQTTIVQDSCIDASKALAG
jgi:hypothetical protein